jgi:2'-5' RNA ligase
MTWLCPALLVPDPAKTQIRDWVLDQDWPLGTKLKDSAKYHITLMYSPDGQSHPHKDAFLAAIEPPASFKVWTARLEQMDPGNKYHARPYALLLSNHWLGRWVEGDVLALADGVDIARARFGAYVPHVTVAEIPAGAELDMFNPFPPPDISWMTPMEVTELHEYYDHLK